MADTIAPSGSSTKQGDHDRPRVSRLDDARDSVASEIGSMRAYARALALDDDTADKLVTAAIAKSCAEIDTVAPGTDIRTWLFGNLHCAFHVAPRQDDSQVANDRMPLFKPRTDGLVTPEEFSAAYNALCVTQREALFLTAAAQLSFLEAAAICQCSVITLKRRAIEGRARLAITLFLTKGFSERPAYGDDSRLLRLALST